MRLLVGLRHVSLGLCAGVLAYAGNILPGYTIERTWNGSTSSSWADVLNWSGSLVPQPGEVAVIHNGLPNYPSITADTTATAVSVGGCASTPCLTNAALSVAAGSTLTLGMAATVSGGSISVSGTLNFGSQQAVFYNPLASLLPGSALTFTDQLRLGNLGTEFGGLLTMSGAVIGGQQLILDPGQEITGSGTLNLATLSGSGSEVQASNGILTLNYSDVGSMGPFLGVVHGATMILDPSGNGSLQTGDLEVDGTWKGAPAGNLVLNANPDLNAPVLTTQGIELYGRMTVQGNANPTVWILTGGQGLGLDAPGSIADSNPLLTIGLGTNLRLDQTPGDSGTGLYLGNGTIQAATGSNTSAFFNNSNARQFAGRTTTIDGVQFTNGGSLYVEGTLNLNGGSLVNNGIIGVLSGAELHVATTDSTINGTGRLMLVGGTLSAGNLTNGNGHTIDNSGTILASSLVNHGDIVADGDQPLSINAGSVTNSTDGRMAALWGATLHIQSDVTNEGLLTTGISPPIIYFSTPNGGGTIDIDGALRNNGTVDLVAADGRDAHLAVTGVITNNGIFSLEASGNQASATAAGFLNNGQVLIGSGTSVRLTGGYTQSGASTETSLDGDLTVGVGQEVDIQGGTLDGNGTIHGNVDMSGTLSPGHSPGQLSIFGDLVMQSGSLLRMEVGPGGFDHLIVTGAFVYKGGNLEIDFLQGTDPTLGSSFDLFDFGSIDGWFGASEITITGLDTSYRLDFDPASGTAKVDIRDDRQAVPEPTAFSSALLGLAVLALRRRKRSLRVRPLSVTRDLTKFSEPPQ